jgi:hypothetical protein
MMFNIAIKLLGLFAKIGEYFVYDSAAIRTDHGDDQCGLILGRWVARSVMSVNVPVFYYV